MSDQRIDNLLNEANEERSKPYTLYESLADTSDLPQGGLSYQQSLRLNAIDDEDMLRLQYQRFIEEADDPEDAWYRVQSSKLMSDITGDSQQGILENFDGYVTDWFGKTTDAVSAWTAIKDSWTAGMIDMQIGKLAWQQAMAYTSGDQQLQDDLQAQIEALEAERPPDDQARRGLPVKVAKGAAGLLPIMIQSMAGGAEEAAAGMAMGAAVGSAIPGVGTLAGGAGGYVSGQMAGSAREMMEIEGGLTYYELGKLEGETRTEISYGPEGRSVEEFTERMDPAVRFATAMIVGGVNAAIEMIPLDDILDNLGITRAANKSLRRQIKKGLARFLKSDAYQSAAKKITGRIIGGTVENTAEEAIQQLNTIMWRELAIEINNSNLGTNIEHATMSELLEEMEQTVLQSALGMGGISFVAGVVGAPGQVTTAARQTARANRVADILTEAGYDLGEEGTVEARIGETMARVAEDTAGRSMSPIATEFSGEGENLRVTGTNARTEAHSGSLDYYIDDDGNAHITGAEFAGRSVEAKEIYRALEDAVGEGNIVWELEGETAERAQVLKDTFSEEGFVVNLGKDTKFTDLKVTDRATLQANLRTAFPEFRNEEVEAAIGLVEARAGAMGMDTNEFIQTYIHERAFVSGLDLKADGQNVRGVRTVLAEGKAMFYLGKNANFETWAHEFGHVVRGTLSERELIDVENTLGIERGVWDVNAEEKFVEALMNYAEGKKVDTALQGPMAKVVQYLNELWTVAKKLFPQMELSEEQIATYDRLFTPSQERQEAAAQPGEGRLAQRAIVTSQRPQATARETSLGYGVATFTGNAEAIERFRQQQARREAKLTFRGEEMDTRPIFRRIAQDVLEYMDENITAEELQRRMSVRYERVKRAFDNQAMGIDAEERAKFEASLETMRKEIQEMVNDAAELGVRIPQMGFIATADIKGDTFLKFGETLEAPMKQRLRKLEKWLKDNQMDWSKMVDIEGRGIWFSQFDDFFKAIETGTGADVYDALVRATGSQKNASGILADLGVTGGMATAAEQITGRTVYLPAHLDIIGNWSRLDKRSPQRFDLTVGEVEAIRSQNDPAADHVQRHLQLDTAHDTLIQEAGLWDDEIENFYANMWIAQAIDSDFFKAVVREGEQYAKKIQNIQELEKYLQANPEQMEALKGVADALGASAMFDGDNLAWATIEKRLIPDVNERGEEVMRPQFHYFARRIPQLLWDYMPNEKRERIRAKYVQAAEAGFRDPALRGKVRKGFWARNPISKEGTHWLKGVLSGIKTNKKTVGALNLSSMCPMFQIGANGCYVTGMAATGSRVNLYSSAFYAADILTMNEKWVKTFNDLGGLRLNGTGDWDAGVGAVARDVIKHANMRGLKLKIITKQEATLRIIQEFINDPDPDVAAGAKDIVVQTTVDPYWIPVRMDVSPNGEIGGAADTHQIATYLARYHELSGERKQQAFEAIKEAYRVWGQDVALKDGVIARKYGFSSDQVQDFAGRYPDVNIQLRAVVGTKKEIAEYALWAPGILQTWMHAKMGDSMYSDVEGRWLNDGEVGNFRLGNWITEQDDGELHVEGGAKTHAELDAWLRENYSQDGVLVRNGKILEMPQHQVIINVLKGHQDQVPSSLCCQTGVSDAECNDCISLCHSRDSMKGESLQALVDISREHRLFQAEQDPVAGDGVFAENYNGRTEDGNPIPVWGDSEASEIRVDPLPYDLPYYINNPSHIATKGYYRPGMPGELMQALAGAYPRAIDPQKPPGWSVEKYHDHLGGLRPEKLTWAEQVKWIADQMEDLGFTVYATPLPDGSVQYELTGPENVTMRMGQPYQYQEGMPDQLDYDVDFTPPGEDRHAYGPDWVNTLRGLARLVGKEALEAERELDRRTLDLWRRSQPRRLLQAEAYHGAAKLFDAFSHEFMGTGEGAQSYGWGTYLTTVERIAGEYAKARAREIQPDDRVGIYQSRMDDDAFEYIATMMDYRAAYHFGDVKDAKEAFQVIMRHIRGSIKDLNRELEVGRKKVESMRRMADKMLEEGTVESRIYHPEGAEVLRKDADELELSMEMEESELARYRYVQDWLKKNEDALYGPDPWMDVDPRQKVPRVIYRAVAWEGKQEDLIIWERQVPREQLLKIIEGIQKRIDDGFYDLDKKVRVASRYGDLYETYYEALDDLYTDLSPGQRMSITGEKLMSMLRRVPLDPKIDDRAEAASKFLLDVGIDGVSYPAQYKSGGRGDRARNYVVFDDQQLRITEKRLFQTEFEMEPYALPDTEIDLSTPEKVALNNALVEIKQILVDAGILPDDVLYAMKGDSLGDLDTSTIEEYLERVGERRTVEEFYEEQFEEDLTADDAFEWDMPTDIFEWAKLAKGVTEDPNEAGYVLPDGTMLDFSGKREGGTPGERAEDHRQLNLPVKSMEGYSDQMYAFMEAGAMRVDAFTPFAEFHTLPTPAQADRLQDILGFSDGVVEMFDGERRATVEGSDAAQIMGQARRFFRGEEIGTVQLFQAEEDALAESAGLPLEELVALAETFETVEEFKQHIAEEFADREGADLSALEDAWYETFWRDHREEVDEAADEAQKFLQDMQDHDVLVGFLDLFGESLAELGKQDPLVYVAARRAHSGQKISATYAQRVREQFARDPEFWAGMRTSLLSEGGSDIFADTRMEDRVRIARSIEDPNDRLAFWRGELSYEETVVAHDQAVAKLGVLEDKIEKGEKVAKEKIAAAKKAVDEKYKTRKYMDKLAKRINTKPAKSSHWRYREAIEEIQARFDPKRRSKGTIEGREMIAELQEELGEHIVGDTRRSLNQFTVEELEALANQVNELRRQGRELWKDQQARKKERRTANREALISSLLRGEDLMSEEFWGSDEKRAAERKGRMLRQIRASMDRPNRIFRYLDGDIEEGNWHRRVWRRINQLTDSEIRHIDRRWGVIVDKMKELGLNEKDFYERKITFEGVTYNLNDVMFFYGASQNDKARAAVAYGVLTKDAEKDGLRIMQGFIDQLSENDKAFVDFVLDQYEGDDWTRFQAFANDVLNMNPEKENRYLALFRKDNHNQSFQDELKLELETRAGLGRHVPQQGMVQERKVIKDIRQKPVRTDFIEVVRRSIEMQEHMIHFGGFVRDMIALQNNDEFKTAMRQRWGQEGVDWFRLYIDQIANPNAMREQDILGGLARHITSGMGVAYLAFNIGTVLKQISALPLYLGYASPARIAKAAGEFALHPARMWKKVSEMDPQLKHRVIDQLIERFKQEGRIDDVAKLKLVRRGKAKIAELGFKPIEWVDMAVAAIGWEATYQQKLAETHGNERAAREYAQDVMLKTQSAGRIKDLPQAYRTGTGFKRLFLVFSNQIHQMYQMMFRDLPAAAKQRNIRFLVMSAVGLAISMGFEGMVSDRELPDEPEDVARWLGIGVLEKIPLIGKDAASGLRGWKSNLVSPGAIVADVAIAAGKVAKAIEEDDWDGVPLSVWKTLDDAVGVTFGLPMSGPRKIYRAFAEQDPLELLGRKPKE